MTLGALATTTLLYILVTVNCITTIIEDSLNALGEQICGDIILLGDGSDYISADQQQFTPFNIGPHANTTTAYIFVECVEDIILSINLIKEFQTNYGIEQSFRIRSGRHHFGGFSKCSGCIVIDVSRLNDISKISDNCNDNKFYLNIASGANLANLVSFLKDEDVMIPHGNCQTVGVGGFLQSGGIGAVVRYYGLSIDYIVGIKIILENGALIQIIDKKYESHSQSQSGDYLKTQILIPASDASAYTDHDLQDILWAVRGGGGGNFGVITNFILKPFKKPDILYHFKLVWSITNDIDVIKKLLATYQWYFDPANNPSDKLSMYLEISPTWIISDDFPNGYQLHFLGAYVIKNDNSKKVQRVTNIIQSIIDYSGIMPVLIEQQEYSYYEYYQNVPFVSVPPDPFPAIATSRLVQKPGWNEQFVDSFSEILYEQIVSDQSLYNLGYGPFILAEPMGGNAERNDKKFRKTSFDGRNGWSSIVVAQFLTDVENIQLLDIATDKLLNDYDVNALSMLGQQKFIGFMDGFQNINDIDIVYYPTTKVFDKLRRIKTKIDPNNFFNFNFSIPTL